VICLLLFEVSRCYQHELVVKNLEPLLQCVHQTGWSIGSVCYIKPDTKKYFVKWFRMTDGGRGNAGK
jgi:hypothetical protein